MFFRFNNVKITCDSVLHWLVVHERTLFSRSRASNFEVKYLIWLKFARKLDADWIKVDKLLRGQNYFGCEGQVTVKKIIPPDPNLDCFAILATPECLTV